MDRRKFIQTSGWTMLGVAATGSLLGSCAPGSKEAKKLYEQIKKEYPNSPEAGNIDKFINSIN